MRRCLAALAALFLSATAHADFYSPPASSSGATVVTNTIAANVTADGFSANDGVLASAASTLTSASRACVAGDVGKIITVAGAGTLGTIAAPAAPTVQQWLHDSLGGTTYFVKTTYVDAAGGETTASPETSLVANASSLIFVSPPPPISGAIGWNVYVSNTAGGGTGAETKQNGALATAPVTNGVTAAGNATLHFASVPSSIIGPSPPLGMTYLISDTTAPTAIAANTFVTSVTTTTVVMNQNAAGPGVGSGDSIVFTPVNSTGASTYLPFWHNWYEPTFGLVTGTALPGANTTSYAPPAVGILTNPACTGSAYNLPFSNGSGFSYSGTSKAEWAIGTDNSAALNTQIAANPNALITLPLGKILLNSTTIALDKVELLGQGVIGQGTSQGGQTWGSQFLLTSLTTQPFTVKGGVRLSGVALFQPGVVVPGGSPPAFFGAPPIYPPVFEDNGTSDINTFQLDHDMIVVTDLFDQVGTGSIKTIKWDHLNPWCIDTCIQMKKIGETMYVSDTDFNPNNMEFDGSATTTKLWSGLNSAWFVATGAGAPNAPCATVNTGNFAVSNIGFHGFSVFVAAFDAHFSENNLAAIDGNAEQFLMADPGSNIDNTVISGIVQTGSILTASDNTNNPGVDYKGSCTTGGGSKGIQFLGGTFVSQGNMFSFDNGGGTGNMQDLVIDSFKVAFCQRSVSPNPCTAADLLYANDVKIDLQWLGNSVTDPLAGTTVDGIVLVNTSQAEVVGNAFNSLFYSLDMGSWVAGPTVFVGNTTQSTGGAQPINNGAAQGLVIGPNTFDKAQAGKIQKFNVLANVTAGVPVCQANGCTATGTGYGTTQTGTVTLTTNGGKFVCSTYPVLNVTTNGSGNITTVNSVTTAGSCTVMGGTADEVWTVGGALSAGSNALFALTWSAVTQTYTATTGLRFAEVHAYGAGGQGGGGASTVSTTASSGGGGGGGGAQNICKWPSTTVGSSQTVTVGVGGRNGGRPSPTATGAGTTGQDGTLTSFGALCTGNPGGAGFGGINAATVAGGGAGAGIATTGNDGASGAGGTGQQGGGAGGAGAAGVTSTSFGNGSGGGGSSAAGVAFNGAVGLGGGSGGGSGGGLTTVPGTNAGGNGGRASGIGALNSAAATGGAANNNGTGGGAPTNAGPDSECGGGAGGGGSALTTTVAGNGGNASVCSGGGGGGSVVNGAASAPGFGGAGGNGELDVIEWF